MPRWWWCIRVVALASAESPAVVVAESGALVYTKVAALAKALADVVAVVAAVAEAKAEAVGEAAGWQCKMGTVHS